MKYPTAKEVFDKMLEENDECTSTEMMIAFAKIHVEKALIKAYDNANILIDDKEKAKLYSCIIDGKRKVFSIDKHSIKNSYPLNNIN